MRNDNEKNFIMVYNKLITDGEAVHLSEVELYLYSLLKRKVNYEGTTETTISVLATLTPIKFAGDFKRSTTIIKKGILSLMNKGTIQVKAIGKEGELLEDFTANDPLIVRFGNSEGFVMIPYSKFDSFRSMSDYYIYTATAKWFNDTTGGGTFNCSLDRWGRILGIATRRTVVKKLDEAISRGIIYKNIGDYEDSEGGQKLQKVNSYRITPFKKEEKSNMTKQADTNKFNELLHAQYYKDDYEEVGRAFTTYKDDLSNDVFPLDEHYAFYMDVAESIKHREPSSEEIEFLKKANLRLSILRKSSSPPFLKEWKKGVKLYESMKVAKVESPMIEPIETQRGTTPEKMFGKQMINNKDQSLSYTNPWES